MLRTTQSTTPSTTTTSTTTTTTTTTPQPTTTTSSTTTVQPIETTTPFNLNLLLNSFQRETTTAKSKTATFSDSDDIAFLANLVK